MKVKIETLYEDDHLILINKPAQILTLPDRYNHDLPNIYHYYLGFYPNLKMVHRLDFETSGILCLAKDVDSHQNLNTQFEKQQIHKTYIAIAEGSFHEQRGSISAPIRAYKSGKNGIDKLGKKSQTDFEVTASYKAHTLLRLFPKTGRTHQIRLHLSHIHHPIVGDALYGGHPLFLSTFKKKYYSNHEERPLISRTALHAFKLEFIHPKNQEPMQIEAPLPKDMRASINQLNKHSNPS